MGADEKFNTVLEQYSLEIKQMYKFGGALYLETEQGFFVLRQRPIREGRAAFEEKIKTHMSENGFKKTDIALKNNDGNFVTEGNYGETYTLKRWYKGEECDFTNHDSVVNAVKTLARMHRSMSGLDFEKVPYVTKPAAESFSRRTGEMRRIITYLRKQKQKNEFESWMEKQLPKYVEQAYKADGYLNKEYDKSLLTEALKTGGFFHGNFTGHNIIAGNSETAVVNFDRAKLGPKIHDLYHFLRKCGEKNNWDSIFLNTLIEEYCTENTIDEKEQNLLFAQLLYPEKFWKIVNMYFNGKKTWVPGKVEEKLTSVCSMQDKKEKYLSEIIGNF